MLKISEALMRQIYDHTEASYPYECCGLMIGTAGNPGVVHAFRTCRNLNTERARDRYEMDPEDQLRAQHEFAGGPWDIIGIYHSHPDHPSRPSETDTDRAWPGYSYVIISVRNGKVASANSWVLNESEHQFEEEPIVIKGDETK